MHEAAHLGAVPVHLLERDERLPRRFDASTRRGGQTAHQLAHDAREHAGALTLEGPRRDVGIAEHPDAAPHRGARREEGQRPLAQLLGVVDEDEPRHREPVARHGVRAGPVLTHGVTRGAQDRARAEFARTHGCGTRRSRIDDRERRDPVGDERVGGPLRRSTGRSLRARLRDLAREALRRTTEVVDDAPEIAQLGAERRRRQHLGCDAGVSGERSRALLGDHIGEELVLHGAREQSRGVGAHQGSLPREDREAERRRRAHRRAADRPPDRPLDPCAQVGRGQTIRGERDHVLLAPAGPVDRASERLDEHAGLAAPRRPEHAAVRVDVEGEGPLLRSVE